MSCAEFISNSFAVRDAAHFAHLSTRSYAQHVALGSFYEALLPIVDKYAEVCIGLDQEIPTYPKVKPLDYDDPLELLTDYLEHIQAHSRKDARGNQALMNILAELEELTAQTIYKMKFLK